MRARILVLCACAFMLLSGPIQAAPAPVQIESASHDGKIYSDLYFDFEEGVWVGRSGSDWKDFAQDQKLRLSDGGYLVVQNNMPCVERAGQVSPLN